MKKTRLSQHGSLLVVITSAQGLLAPYAHAIQTSETISTAVASGRVYTSNYDALQITDQGSLISSSNSPALQVSFTGNLASLVNNGTLYGTNSFGVLSTGTIGTINNTGMINGPGFGGVYLDFGSSTGTVINSGTIGNTNSSNYVGSGITSSGVLGTLKNTASGVISGRVPVYNRGTLNLLDNAGTVTNQNNLGVSDLGAIFNNAGTINTIVNSGTVIYDHTGTNQTGGAAVRNWGVIGEINNTGTLTSETFGIRSDDFMSSIGTITNSGLIQAPQAISLENYFTAATPVLTNSGTIARDILNLTSLPFTIAGGTGTTGTLTGYANSIGILQTNGSALTFASGSLLLNDNISSHNATILNDAAKLLVVNPITLTGNYHQNADAALILGVADSANATGSTLNDTGYGRLIVNGAATIDQGSHISLTRTGNTYQFAVGQRYVVIDANSTDTNYNTDKLNYSATGYTGTVTGATVNDGSHSVLVVSLGRAEPDRVTRPSTPPASSAVKSKHDWATRPVASAALGSLTSYSGISPQLLELYNASLAINDTAEANRVGEGLSSSQNINASTATATAIAKAMTVVGTHMDSVRNPQTAGASGVATGDDYSNNWIFWGQPFGGYARQGTTENVSGYHAKFGGLLLGADRALGNDWRAGAAVNFSNTAVHGKDNLSGSTSTADNYGVIGYAAYSGNPWYLNLSAGLNRQSYQSSRQVDFTGFSGTAKSKFNGQSVTLQSEAGYPFTLPADVVLTPLAGLTYGYQHVDGYQETDGNGMALKVGSAHKQSVASDIGVRVEKSVATRLGDLTPFVQIAWIHQYDDRQMRSTASYAADTIGETQFTTEGASPAKDMAGVTLGSTLYDANNLSLDARYDLQAGQQYQAHTFSLRLRKTF